MGTLSSDCTECGDGDDNDDDEEGFEMK